MLPIRLLQRTLGFTISNNIVQSGFKRLKPIASCVINKNTYSSQYIINSPYSNVDIPKITIQDFVYENFEKWSELTALECGITGKKYTYSQLKKLSKNVALGLINSGMKPGQVITLMLPNSPEFIIAFLGALEAGLIVSTLNPLYSSDEIKHQIEDSNSICIITYSQKINDVNNAIAKMSNRTLFPTIVVNSPEDGLPVGCRSFSELLEMKFTDDTKLRNIKIHPDDDAIMLYSSGTTGLPKGVILTHSNIVANCAQITNPDVRITVSSTESHQDIIVGVLPFFHVYGLTCIVFSNLNYGCKLLTLPKFEPESFLAALKQSHAAYLVPPIIQFLANESRVTSSSMDKLRIICNGAAAVSISDAEKLLKKRQIYIISGYGMTEASPVITASWNKSTDLASVGSPVSNSQMKIVNTETGEIIDPSQTGEICARGPHIMKGYHNNEEATAATLKDGWLHTGDVGYIGKGKYLYIVDRMKELIKVKGFQVAPLELEETLKQHPGVSDVAVVGKADARFGEVPVAFVVPRAGTKPTEQDLQKFVASKVAEYKRINSVIFMQNIPKNTTGKILRRELREILLK